MPLICHKKKRAQFSCAVLLKLYPSEISFILINILAHFYTRLFAVLLVPKAKVAKVHFIPFDDSNCSKLRNLIKCEEFELYFGIVPITKNFGQ